MNCPLCGLPMSISYFNGDENNEPVWYCDGPNDNTNRAGCFNTTPVTTPVVGETKP